MKYTLALLINSTFSLAIALSEIQQGNQGSVKGMQLLVTSVFRTPRWPHLSPYQEKQKKPKPKQKKAIYRENKIHSHSLYNWAYTLFTAQKQFTKNKTSQNHLPSLVFHDFYRLRQKTVT